MNRKFQEIVAGRVGQNSLIRFSPLLRDFITDTFLPWSRVNKRTWVHDEFRSRPLIKALGNKPMDEISPILIEKYKRDRRASKTARGGERSNRRPWVMNPEFATADYAFQSKNRIFSGETVV